MKFTASVDRCINTYRYQQEWCCINNTIDHSFSGSKYRFTYFRNIFCLKISSKFNILCVCLCRELMNMTLMTGNLSSRAWCVIYGTACRQKCGIKCQNLTEYVRNIHRGMVPTSRPASEQAGCNYSAAQHAIRECRLGVAHASRTLGSTTGSPSYINIYEYWRRILTSLSL